MLSSNQYTMMTKAIILFCFLVTQVTASECPTEELTNKINNVWKHIENFTAQIIHTMPDTEEEWTGTMTFTRSNTFYISYTYPEEHIIVNDGQYLWTVFPEAKQVIKSSRGFSLFKWENIVKLDWEEIKLDFDIDAPPLKEEDNPVIILTPILQDFSPVKRIELTFHRKKLLLENIKIIYKEDEIETITISDVITNQDIPEDYFTYTSPMEFEIIDNTFDIFSTP